VVFLKRVNKYVYVCMYACVTMFFYMCVDVVCLELGFRFWSLNFWRVSLQMESRNLGDQESMAN